MTGAERVRRHRLKHGPVTKPVTKPNGIADAKQLGAEIAGLKAELAGARQQAARAATEITELKAELARQLHHRTRAEAGAAKPAPLPRAEADERVIKGLRTQLRNSQAKLRHLTDWFRITELPEKAGMSRSTYNKIVKALHPDAAPSEEDRAEGCRAFNAWVDNIKRRARVKVA